MKSVSVVIPAYNEEANIRKTIKAVKMVKDVEQIIVVDDGSTDNTADYAQQEDVELIKINNNLGKGKALNLGCFQCNKELIALIDADLCESAGELSKLIEPVANGEADMAIAAFPKAKKKGGIGLVKGLANLGIRAYGGDNLRAPLSGQRVMNRKAFKEVFPFATGFGVEVVATIKVLQKGLLIKEVETQMMHRETGRSLADFNHRGKQFYHILSALFRLRLSRS